MNPDATYRPLFHVCKCCGKKSNVCKCSCSSCGKKPMSGTRMKADGRCADCHRHPPGTKWCGGTIPEGCELYVMPKNWKGAV